MAGYKNKQITRYWSNEEDIDIEALKNIFLLKNNISKLTKKGNNDIEARKFADIDIEAQKKILIERTEEAPVSV